MKYRAYPKYKDSGVEWLGEVPEHWEVIPIRHISKRIKTGSTPPTAQEEYYENGTVPWFGPGSFDEKIVLSKPVKFINTRAIHGGVGRLFKAGSTMVVTIGATLGKVSSINEASSCNQQITVVEFDDSKVLSAFGTYQLKRLEPTLRAIAPSATLPILSQNEIADIVFALPNISVQRDIANFLDRETNKIDTLLSKKRALIEKLKEKRTALISRTVTRGLPPDAARAAGLDPHPKLKPSGVEWLGNVPEHWEIKPMKYVASVVTGFAFSSDDFVDDGIPLVRIGDIKKDGNVDLSNAKHLPNEFGKIYKKVMIHDGDIVMAMTGATIGKAGRYQSDNPALLNQRVCIFRANRSFYSGFLWYLLNSGFYIEHVLLTAFGGAQPNISDKELLDCIITVPPTSEQITISAYLEIESEKIDKLLEKTEAAINHLQEYRTALITAAVTGKIDVRETEA